MKKQAFIGRQEEIGYFLEELKRELAEPNAVRVFFLKGVQSVGKTALLSELVTQLFMEKRPLLLIRPFRLMEEAVPDKWLACLNAAVQTNHRDVRARIAQFRVANKGLTNSEGREHNWLELLKERVLMPELEDPPMTIQLLFVLDDYDQLLPDKKKWFSQHFFTPLKEFTNRIDARFVLAGKESIFESVDLQAYWNITRSAVVEKKLAPLSKDQIADFIKTSGLDESMAGDLTKKSKGLPAVFLKLIEPLLEQLTPEVLSGDGDKIFEGKTDSQKKWLRWAAHIGQISEESLSIFENDKQGKAAFNYLKEGDGFKLKNIQGKYIFDGPLADAILTWEKGASLEMYRQLEVLANDYQEIVANIPKSDHRNALNKLAVFNYFNEELLSAIVPKKVAEIMKFCRKNKDYLVETDENLKIADDVKRLIETYNKMMPEGDEPEIVTKLQKYWETKRANILEEMTSLEENIEEEEESLVGLREELREALGKMREYEGRLLAEKQKEINRLRPAKKKVKKDFNGWYKLQIALGITVEFLGIILLYIGILFVEQLSYAYSTLGVFLIAGGLFWPYKKPIKKKPKVVEEKEEDVRDPMQEILNDKKLRVLNMDVTNLENKRTVLSTNIAKQKRALSALDTALSEPYFQ